MLTAPLFASSSARHVVIKTLLIILVVTYLVLIAYAYLMAERRIFRPPVSSYSASNVPIQMITTQDDVEIALLHLPNDAADFTILYSHGNAEDIGNMLPAFELIRDAGFAVVAYDYRGYGMSARRRPTVSGAVLDAEAAYRHAVDSLQVDPARLLLLGRSVGSGPATDLATRFDAAGLIIEGGFTSAFRVVTRLPILPFDHFPNLRLLRDLDVPLLIIHGDRDAVIDVRHGRQLFTAASEPKRMLEIAGGGHSDLMLIAADQYLDALKSFADLVRKAQEE